MLMLGIFDSRSCLIFAIKVMRWNEKEQPQWANQPGFKDAVYPATFSWCELPSSGDTGCENVCLLSSIIELDATQCCSKHAQKNTSEKLNTQMSPSRNHYLVIQDLLVSSFRWDLFSLYQTTPVSCITALKKVCIYFLTLVWHCYLMQINLQPSDTASQCYRSAEKSANVCIPRCHKHEPLVHK